ncbi:AmmeMemoRadiSam system protein B [Neptunomonas sp.]|uniref:AmmeMemoRadiSam system protein B n=1 Tax=Neptunomonas sp. TaxID=1971898 RepID=UPI0025FFA403|nr:AmmeMemoRadiSam system protein B [Neptunomonas sp.]
MKIRPAAVAGLFYPEDKAALCSVLADLMPDNPLENVPLYQRQSPMALIVPHAGYIYSGAVAALGYRLLKKCSSFNSIYLFGPNHRVPLEGCAVPLSDYFSTPLGNVDVNRKAIKALLEYSIVIESDVVHAQEHCLEVQLPFLQYLQINGPVVPVIVGECAVSDIACIIEPLLIDPTTLVVVSTDLSHFHSYKNAQKVDAHTDLKIMNADHDLKPTEACGCNALNGLLLAIKHQNLTIKKLSQCNSGDTAGAKDRVVGYAGYGIF